MRKWFDFFTYFHMFLLSLDFARIVSSFSFKWWVRLWGSVCLILLIGKRDIYVYFFTSISRLMCLWAAMDEPLWLNSNILEYELKFS